MAAAVLRWRRSVGACDIRRLLRAAQDLQMRFWLQQACGLATATASTVLSVSLRGGAASPTWSNIAPNE